VPFGRKTPVQLTVEPSTVTAGEEIICRVDVGKLDAKVQGGRVELGYANTYSRLSQDSDGDNSPGWTTEWVPVQTVPMFAGIPEPGQRVFRLRLPRDEPPSVTDTVDWEVRAIVDRRRGLDAWAEAPLVVQAAPGVLARRMETPTESGTEIPMTVELATRELRPGGILAGTVTANPTVEGGMRGLRVQLVRERHEQDGIVERDVEAVVRLTGEAELRPGVSILSPFQIAAPADPAPCWDAKYNSEHWYLEVVADVPLRRDEVTRIELLVTQGRKEQDDGVNGPRPEPYPA
jgi:hypothetical protein